MAIAMVMLLLLAAYAGIGLLAGAAFVIAGVSKVDHAARGAGAPWTFRVMIFPGAAVLWPVVLRWWIHAHGRGAVAP